MRSVFLVAIVALAAASQGCQRATALAPSPRVASVTCMTGVGVQVAPPEMLPPQAAGGGDEDDGGATVTHPCKAGAPEHAAAMDAVSALAARVNDLADDGDPTPVKEELVALLATTCFELSQGDEHPDLEMDSALALKSWWQDGGERWVEHYLDLDATRLSIVPPSPRRSLTTAKRRAPKTAHPLAPLLCSPGDARQTTATGCGHETVGWAKRADRALALRAEAQHVSWGGKTEEACARAAQAEEPQLRYASYRTCLEDVAPRRDALPLGRFKAPTDGWFVVGGRRESRCVEMRAYDLASGAAYVVSECPRRSGTLATPPGPMITVSSGRLPVSMLREAAWMIMFAHVIESRVRVEATAYEVPKEIAISRPSLLLHGGSGSSRCGLGGTPRSWSWMREKNGALVGQASGILRWPTGCEDGDAHAAELLGVAEDGFEPGCTPAPPPSRIGWGTPGPAIERGQPATLDDPTFEALRLELAKPALPRTACSKR